MSDTKRAEFADKIETDADYRYPTAVKDRPQPIQPVSGTHRHRQELSGDTFVAPWEQACDEW